MVQTEGGSSTSSDVEVSDRANEIFEALPDDPPPSIDSPEKIQDLFEQFQTHGLSERQSWNSVEENIENTLGEELSGIDSGSGQSGIAVDSISSDYDSKAITTEAVVVEDRSLSERQAKWMHQQVIIGDDTGTVRMILPHDKLQAATLEFDNDHLQEGESYKIKNVIVNTDGNSPELRLISNSVITPIDKEFNPPTKRTIEGAIVDVQNNSGFIYRCPHEGCSRVLQSGECVDHGDVDGEPDLRVKAVIDNGDTPTQVFFDTGATSALTGMEPEQAEEVIQKKGDNAIEQKLRSKLVGRYYSLNGSDAGQYFIITGYDRISPDPVDNIDDHIHTLKQLAEERVAAGGQ